MTRDEILNMPAGEEMDTLVTEKVMGEKWQRHEHKHILSAGWEQINENVSSIVLRTSCWQPSLDIGDAWDVVEKMREDYTMMGKFVTELMKIYLLDCIPESHGALYSFLLQLSPLVICRAALLAVL